MSHQTQQMVMSIIVWAVVFGIFYLLVIKPQNKKEKEINLQKYTDSEDYKVGFYVDLIDNHWFLFSSKGVFKFDQNFENVQHLLDESIFENNQLW